MALEGLLVHLVTALGAAVVGAAGALAAGLPLTVGYILAGVAIGPFTPGIIGNTDAIAALAEVGVVFLMFVIGAQLSLKEMLRASKVAIGGALVQVAAMIGIGSLMGLALGWEPMTAYAFGAVISNSSSTVLGKILTDRGELDTAHSRLGIAWSSVQDISTVGLVAIMTFSSPTAGGVSAMVGNALLFFFGLVPLTFLVVPRLLRKIGTVRNREFFGLTTITLALATAAGAAALGISVALGALLVGIVVGESDLADRILGDVIPLRDAFSGVFFVSIGMLFDPRFVLASWPLVLAGFLLIVPVKGLVTYGVARALGCPIRLAALLGAGLAQSAEFSFLMARIGLESKAVPLPVFNLMLTATVLSILVAPWLNDLVPRLLRGPAAGGEDPGPEPAADELSGHAIVAGYGRVGRIVCRMLADHAVPYLVVEEDLKTVEELRLAGTRVVYGDAGIPRVLDRAGLARARLLVLCIPERAAIRRALEHARETTPGITLLARTHTEEEGRFLQERWADEAVYGELELALELGRRALLRFGVGPEAIEREVAEEHRALGTG